MVCVWVLKVFNSLKIFSCMVLYCSSVCFSRVLLVGRRLLLICVVCFIVSVWMECVFVRVVMIFVVSVV